MATANEVQTKADEPQPAQPAEIAAAASPDAQVPATPKPATPKPAAELKWPSVEFSSLPHSSMLERMQHDRASTSALVDHLKNMSKAQEGYGRALARCVGTGPQNVFAKKESSRPSIGPDQNETLHGFLKEYARQTHVFLRRNEGFGTWLEKQGVLALEGQLQRRNKTYDQHAQSLRDMERRYKQALVKKTQSKGIMTRRLKDEENELANLGKIEANPEDPTYLRSLQKWKASCTRADEEVKAHQAAAEQEQELAQNLKRCYGVTAKMVQESEKKRIKQASNLLLAVIEQQQQMCQHWLSELTNLADKLGRVSAESDLRLFQHAHMVRESLKTDSQEQQRQQLLANTPSAKALKGEVSKLLDQVFDVRLSDDINARRSSPKRKTELTEKLMASMQNAVLEIVNKQSGEIVRYYNVKSQLIDKFGAEAFESFKPKVQTLLKTLSQQKAKSPRGSGKTRAASGDARSPPPVPARSDYLGASFSPSPDKAPATPDKTESGAPEPTSAAGAEESNAAVAAETSAQSSADPAEAPTSTPDKSAPEPTSAAGAEESNDTPKVKKEVSPEDEALARKISSQFNTEVGRKLFIRGFNRQRGATKELGVWFDLMANLFRTFLDSCVQYGDLKNSSMCMIMSQTFFRWTTDEKPKKQFMQEVLMHHSIWKDPLLWEETFLASVREEVQRNCPRTPKESAMYAYQQIVSAQLSSAVFNMISFNVPFETVRSLVHRMSLAFNIEEKDEKLILRSASLHQAKSKA